MLTQTVVYDFGNNPANSQLFLQPTGNGGFNDQCVRLVGSKVTASTVLGINVGASDRLYFPSTDTANGDTTTVEFKWLILCTPGSNSATVPWAEITSGTQYKYRGGAAFTAATNPIPNPTTGVTTIAKTASPTQLSGAGVVTYTVRLTNAFTQPVYVSQIVDTLPAGATLGSMVTSSSAITAGNSSAAPAIGATGVLIWRIGTLSAGQGVTIRFVTRTTTTSTISIRNIAIVGDNLNSLIDQSDVVVLRSPTAITLHDFQVARQADGARAIWSTSFERNTLGFIVYRGTSLRFADATAVNGAMVPARGGSSGARYEVIDTANGEAGYYWLVEIELNGRVNTHGPVRIGQNALSVSAMPNKMFLPMIGSR